MESMYIIGSHGLGNVQDRYVKLPEDTPYSPRIGGLDPFIAKSIAIKEAAHDELLHGKDLKPVIDADEGIKLIVGDRPMRMTDWSLMQFANRIGIPSTYALKMAKAGKYELFLENFESWLDTNSGKDFFVRSHGEFVRGVLSSAYVPVDAHFILPQMQKGLMQTNLNFRIDRAAVNPEFSNVRVISDRPIRVGNDPHFVGFRTRTSDVGQSSLCVEFFIFRSRCANGMLFGRHGGTLVNRIHTSRDMVNEGHFEKLLHDQLGRVDELVEMTSEALRDAQARKVRDEDMQRIIDRFKSKSNFGQKDAEALFEEVKAHNTAYSDELTVWGISNALTELAQNHAIDRAEKIEDFAGDLLFAKLA